MKKTLTADYNQNKFVAQTILSNPLPPINEGSFNNVESSHYMLSPQFLEDAPSCHAISIIHNPIPLVKRRIGDICKDESIKAGDISIMPANVIHSAYWDKEALFTILLLKPEFIANAAYEDINPDQVELLPSFAQSDPFIYGIAQGLILQLDSGFPISKAYIDQLASFLAIHLLENYCSIKHKIAENAHDFSSIELQQALDYFDSYIDKQIGLSEISNLLGMSQNHFGRLFKKSIGTPPAQYFMNRRLKKATYLLKATNLSIGVIAVQTGFSSQSQFCNTFRQQLGVTPRQYRTML